MIFNKKLQRNLFRRINQNSQLVIASSQLRTRQMSVSRIKSKMRRFMNKFRRMASIETTSTKHLTESRAKLNSKRKLKSLLMTNVIPTSLSTSRRWKLLKRISKPRAISKSSLYKAKPQMCSSEISISHHWND